MFQIIYFALCFISSAAYSPRVGTPRNSFDDSPSVKVNFPSRRDFLTTTTAGALLGPNIIFQNSAKALAADDSRLLTDYGDPDFKFSFKVPTGWEKSIQSLPDRRKIVLYIKPGSDQKTLVFIAYTPVRSDFTSLGSFGSVDEVSRR